MKLKCRWCGDAFAATRKDAEYCGRRCRQSAWRARGRGYVATPSAEPGLRFAYADPPYPGCARRIYGTEEVDHAQLIAWLEAQAFDGWALSTSSDGLRSVLPLCPPSVRPCPWVKQKPTRRTEGSEDCTEYVLVVGGRPLKSKTLNYLISPPARSGGVLMGRKPLAFCRWLFDLLGMKAGDSLIDLFPGTGIVSRAWAQRSPEPEPQLSLLQKEPSPRARRQLSLLAARVDFVDLSLAPARRVVEGLATRRRPGPPDASFGRERQKER